MIKNYLIIISIFVCFQGFSQENKQFEQFWTVLIQVESGGNPKAIGDNSKAIGIAQIHRAYWQDAVEYDKTIGGKYEDCFNPNYSKKIVRAYVNRYCSRGSIESWARLHNSGPGWKNKKHLTDKYWNRFTKISKNN